MNRKDIYAQLVSVMSSGFVGKLKKFLSDHPDVKEKFYAEGFTKIDSESMWRFLNRVTDRPACANPNCGRPARFTNLVRGYGTFCNGDSTCRSSWLLKTPPNRSPGYARHLANQVREMVASYEEAGVVDGHSKGLGYGFSNKVRNLNPEAFTDIVGYLGPSFTAHQLYDFLFPNARRTCSYHGCDNPVSFTQFRYRKYCNCSCAFKEPDFDAKRKQLWLERTGGRYNSSTQIPEVQLKTNRTRIARELELSNGTRTHHSQRPEVKAKIIEGLNKANLAKSRGKYKWTTEFPWFGARRAKLELERSGGKYTNVSQRPEVFEKSRRSAMAYTDIIFRGHSWQVQGYEDVAVRRLITKYKIRARDIEVPREGIPYYLCGKLRHYFPDLTVGDLQVEIKSNWTLGEKGSALYKGNLKKWKAIAHETEVLLVIIVGNVKGKKSSQPRKGRFLGYRLFVDGSHSVWQTSARTFKHILQDGLL